MLPLKEYGQVTRPQSTDRVYTVFRLLENMCKLLTHSNRQGLYSITPLGKHGRVTHPQSTNMSSSYLNLACLFTKFEVCYCAQTILMQVLEEYLDIHNYIFQIEGAMTE